MYPMKRWNRIVRLPGDEGALSGAPALPRLRGI